MTELFYCKYLPYFYIADNFLYSLSDYDFSEMFANDRVLTGNPDDDGVATLIAEHCIRHNDDLGAGEIRNILG